MPPDSNGVQEELFPSADFTETAPLRFKELTGHVWTKNKAKLIARYLREFVFVTKHGTYIDLFAGRQNDEDDSWAAEQVLSMQPSQFKLRRYHLFELDRAKVDVLRTLPQQFGDVTISVTPGDCNEEVVKELPRGSIGEKTATFCLMDQRTTECTWSTCEHLSNLKPAGLKPELFYFLAQAWTDRTVKSRTTKEARAKTTEWWGRDDWESVFKHSSQPRNCLGESRVLESKRNGLTQRLPVRAAGTHHQMVQVR